MFKRDLCLTATTCRILEGLHLALEVLLGSRIRFDSLKLNKTSQYFGSGEGSFTRDLEEDGEPHPLIFTCDMGRENALFELRVDETWYVARLDSRWQIRVIQKYGSTHSEPSMWMVGTSFADRHREPLFPEHKVQA